MKSIQFSTILVLAAFLRSSTPLYGLQISQEIKKPSSTVYPILHELKSIGWITDFTEPADPQVTDRPRRTYYQLTNQGRKEAEAAIKAMTELTAGMREVLAKPFFAQNSVTAYAVADLAVYRHGQILKATWNVTGGDDPFSIVDSPPNEADITDEIEVELSQIGHSTFAAGPAMKSISDIRSQRIQQLAADILAIPGVEAPDGDDRAAFAIRSGEILVNTAPSADLDAVEQRLVLLLVSFFGAVEHKLTGRIYSLSVEDPRPMW